jgi:small subunit ribosomal protein S5
MAERSKQGQGNSSPGGSEGGDKRRRKRDRGPENKTESDSKERVVQVRRVTKVVKGGKKLSFRAVVVVGDEKGKIAVGVGKASEVIGAVRKGVTAAQKSLVSVPLNKIGSIPHPANGAAGAAKVMIKPASAGSGVIAGGAVRTVLELAGVKNISAKALGSKSPLNNARATINALSKLRNLKDVADERGVPISKLYSK